MKKEIVFNGMSFDADSGPVKECEACVRGKMKEETFPKPSERRTTRPYETMHSDLCGPMQVKSVGGSKYMLIFTDDKEYVHSVEKQTGEKIKKLKILPERNDVKIIRSDNGGEYSSNGFCEIPRREGDFAQIY